MAHAVAQGKAKGSSHTSPPCRHGSLYSVRTLPQSFIVSTTSGGGGGGGGGASTPSSTWLANGLVTPSPSAPSGDASAGTLGTAPDEVRAIRAIRARKPSHSRTYAVRPSVRAASRQRLANSTAASASSIASRQARSADGGAAGVSGFEAGRGGARKASPSAGSVDSVGGGADAPRPAPRQLRANLPEIGSEAMTHSSRRSPTLSHSERSSTHPWLTLASRACSRPSLAAPQRMNAPQESTA